MKGWQKREIPEKTRRPTASSGAIPTCENPVTQPGSEPDSPWWEASVLIAQPPWPLGVMERVYQNIIRMYMQYVERRWWSPYRAAVVVDQYRMLHILCRRQKPIAASDGGDWCEYGTAPERKGKIPEKTGRPAASSCTTPTCGNPVTRPGIEPGPPRPAVKLVQQGSLERGRKGLGITSLYGRILRWPAARPAGNRFPTPACVQVDSRERVRWFAVVGEGCMVGVWVWVYIARSQHLRPPARRSASIGGDPVHAAPRSRERPEVSGRRGGTLKPIQVRSRSVYVPRGNRIRLEGASQKQSSDTHKIPYDRVEQCRERKINDKVSERANVDVFTQNERPCPQHGQTQFLVMGRLFASPPKRAGFDSRPGHFLISYMWESCSTMPLPGGFSVGSPVYPVPCIPTLLHTELSSPSSALKISMLRAARISSTRPFCRMERRWNARAGETAYPEKTCRQAVSSSTIPTCENPGVNPSGTKLASVQPLPLEPKLWHLHFVGRWRRSAGGVRGYKCGCLTQWRVVNYCKGKLCACSLLCILNACSKNHRGRGGTVVRQLTSLLGESGSIPGETAPGFSHVPIAPDDHDVRPHFPKPIASLVGVSAFTRACNRRWICDDSCTNGDMPWHTDVELPEHIADSNCTHSQSVLVFQRRDGTKESYVSYLPHIRNGIAVALVWAYPFPMRVLF
ncbi:hypothetical protein PR048_007975 [Dryococelus australis]|uniref:Uncharacterized protein n=1 Tax=Dryococelus australis TaxID=614101 RepID=A0ABQ9HVR5_9NEOP|nr:hypothetical protein PR048_007975 [Dryococelus australis]